jgi:hypothetical protein
MKNYYSAPTFEVVDIEVEQGFILSSGQQEPSPWEDM